MKMMKPMMVSQAMSLFLEIPGRLEVALTLAARRRDVVVADMAIIISPHFIYAYRRGISPQRCWQRTVRGVACVWHDVCWRRGVRASSS